MALTPQKSPHHRSLQKDRCSLQYSAFRPIPTLGGNGALKFIRKLGLLRDARCGWAKVATCRWRVAMCRLTAEGLALVKQNQVIILREPTRHDKLVLPDTDNGMLPETGR